MSPQFDFGDSKQIERPPLGGPLYFYRPGDFRHPARTGNRKKASFFLRPSSVHSLQNMGLQPPEGFTAHIVLDFAGIGSGRLLVHPQMPKMAVRTSVIMRMNFNA